MLKYKHTAAAAAAGSLHHQGVAFGTTLTGGARPVFVRAPPPPPRLLPLCMSPARRGPPTPNPYQRTR
jgi:hypothetical protein